MCIPPRSRHWLLFSMHAAGLVPALAKCPTAPTLAKHHRGLPPNCRNGGLWRTQVLEVATTGRPRPFSSTDEGGLLGSTMRMARVLVGDPGGAQAEMRLPYDSRWAGVADPAGGGACGWPVVGGGDGLASGVCPVVAASVPHASTFPNGVPGRCQIVLLLPSPTPQVRADPVRRARGAGGALQRHILPNIQGVGHGWLAELHRPVGRSGGVSRRSANASQPDVSTCWALSHIGKQRALLVPILCRRSRMCTCPTRGCGSASTRTATAPSSWRSRCRWVGSACVMRACEVLG